MNVVKRNKHLDNAKLKSKFRNELVRKDSSLGIRGASLLPIVSYNTASVSRPRYQFTKEDGKNSSMGPPSGLPKTTKRKILHNSNSTRPESSSSGLPRPRVLVSESAPDTSVDFCTPRNRPTALRYISSSSRGGYSGTRSGRSTSTSAVEASVILAISEGRGMARGEIGIAAIDLRHPHLVLCQFSDTLLYTHTLTKINYFNPIEIIVPHTFCEGVHPNQLYQLIRDRFPLINLTTVQRRHFNDAAGRQQIQTLCAPQYNGVYLQVLQKFYAVTAAAAVLKYVEYIQCVVFSRESLKIEYHSSENTMVIDVGTATQLELVQPLVQSAGPSCCLLGILGPTYTVGGIRALRAAILQPSCNKDFIEGRLEAVQDLIENDSGLMTGLQDVIKNLSEVDKILFLCMESQNQNLDKIGEAQLNQTLLLKTTMEMVPKLVEALSVAGSGRLRKIKIDFENPHYKDIADRIKTVIQDDAHLEKGVMGSLQRCFAVKPEINGLLDVARRTYSELIEDIQKIVEQLSESYDLPLRLNQNAMKGFHIVLPIAPKNRRSFNVEDLPANFIQVNYSGASVSMTTEELVVLDQQAKESLSEIQKMSNIVIASLLKELRPFMSSLYKLCENIAELDILLALANSSSVGSYIRPEFGDYLDIRNSVHPLLDYNSQVMPVPNDIYASLEQNFTIITGPNMGGKSIYIKQVAVLQIMAQLGCFLPATKAVLRLCDRIFSRMGFNDSVELNASTYVIEMKEMQHIMAGITKSSLVIIDELCRGTNSEEGTSIAWAICEELLMTEAFTFFTTHFIYLTRLEDLYFNVVNRHTAVSEEDVSQTQNQQTRLVYQHKIEIGITKVEHYGMALAEKTNLPADTVKLARELSDLIIKDKKPQDILTPEINDERMLYKLNAEIRLESRKHGDSDETIRALIQKFKSDHPQVIQRLKLQKIIQNNSIPKDTTNTSSDYNTNQTEEFPTVGIESALSKEHHSNNKSKSTHVLCRSSNPDSETALQNSPRDHQYSNIFNKTLTNTPVKTYKPKIVFSTSDHSDSDTSRLNNYSALVRSSNELLTTFGNASDRDNSDNFEENFQGQIVTSHSQDQEISDENCLIEVPNKSNISDFNNNISEINDSFRESNKGPLEGSMIESANEHFDSNDSDIAEALTQVIEEYSSSKGSVDSNESIEIEDNHESSDENMSVDQELMEETVKEIQAELNCADERSTFDILTPPLAFRD